MTLTLKKALPVERDDVERILWTAFSPYVRDLGREITAHHYAFLAGSIERGDVYLALDDEETVGVAVTERRGEGIYIDRLGVVPIHQGRGIGGFLLDRIEEIARSNNLGELSLETAEMAEGNIRLYLRLRDRAPGTALARSGRTHACLHGEDAVTRGNDR
ncbi:GNAT family N-acetyltransferase [Reyranella sp.]|uniref:GNAT family N-acetyltransferase n=1 Tax=Reyranella sp. TaxID=1929291 RepID=UPI0040356541